eukprot:COSAG05_NODE_807_length_7192_cov_92.394191_6_plen_74_part_00
MSCASRVAARRRRRAAPLARWPCRPPGALAFSVHAAQDYAEEEEVCTLQVGELRELEKRLQVRLAIRARGGGG